MMADFACRISVISILFLSIENNHNIESRVNNIVRQPNLFWKTTATLT